MIAAFMGFPISSIPASYRTTFDHFAFQRKDARCEQIMVEEPHSALWVKRGVTDKCGNKTRVHT